MTQTVGWVEQAQTSAWLEHARPFAQGRGGIVKQEQQVTGRDQVEGFGAEGQAQRIGLGQVGGQMRGQKAEVQVHTQGAGSALGEEQRKQARAAADVQNNGIRRRGAKDGEVGQGAPPGVRVCTSMKFEKSGMALLYTAPG